MSEAKFTPGPWGGKAIAAALRAARKHDGSWIDELGDGENMPDEDDASLIAAAPEMYEALEDSVRLMCNNCNACELDANGKPMFASLACETYTRKVAVLNRARGDA